MSDLIRRSDAIKAIEELPNAYNGWSDAYDKAYIIGTLEEVPSADRPQGEWKVRGNPKRNLWECSLCRCTIYSESESDRNKFHKWCGRCGARMKGADDEDSV